MTPCYSCTVVISLTHANTHVYTHSHVSLCVVCYKALCVGITHAAQDATSQASESDNEDVEPTSAKTVYALLLAMCEAIS